MLRLATLLSFVMTALTSVAWADAAADCSQNQNPELRIQGCSQLISLVTQQNPRHPDLFKAYHNRALGYWKTGRHDDAIQDYSKAIQLNAREFSLLYDRATLFLMKRRYDDAIKDYDAALALKPTDAGAYLNRGAAYADKGQFDRAIKDVTKAIEINPRDARAYYNRGVSYVKTGQAERAISDFGKAIDLDPKMAVAYNNRGLVHEAAGRVKEAVADFRKAIALDAKLKASQDGLKRLESVAGSSQGSPAAVAFCEAAKDRAKCLGTRRVIEQLKTDKASARWSNDVDFQYAQGDEVDLLFELMIAGKGKPAKQ